MCYLGPLDAATTLYINNNNLGLKLHKTNVQDLDSSLNLIIVKIQIGTQGPANSPLSSYLKFQSLKMQGL